MIGSSFGRMSLLGVEANAGLDGALHWLRGQANPIRRGVNGAWVAADTEYAPEDTTLRGSFRVPQGTPPPQPSSVTVESPLPIPDRYSGTLRGGVSVPVEDRGLLSPVIVESPLPLPDRYAGTIAGRVEGAPAGGTYRVDAYLVTDTHYKQGEAPVSVSGTWSFAAGGGAGEWRFRLINVATGVQVGGEWSPSANNARRTQYRVDAYLVTDQPYAQGSAPVFLRGAKAGWELTAGGAAGEWRFRLVNTDTGSQEGREWSPADSALYAGLEIRLYAFTDQPYLLQTIPAAGSERWAFTTTNTSPKVVSLHRTGSGEELARWATRTWLVRSYAYQPGDPEYGTPLEHRSYTYDQAVAILAFLAAGDPGTAARLAAALAARQQADGAWAFSFHQLQTAGWDPYFRSGAVAWAAYALQKAADAAAGLPSVDAGALRAAAYRALEWLEAHISADTGLVAGGRGRYGTNAATGQETFDPAYVVRWFSTEHNADAWMAFRASRDAYHRAVADRIRDAMLERLWDPMERRFWQGAGPDGTPDASGALDVHTWGSMLLRAWRMGDLASDALSRAQRLYPVTDAQGRTGFRPYVPEEGYPGAAVTLWLEGSFGAVMALHRAGQDTRLLEEGLATFQEPDGSFRYATVRDGTYEIGTAKAVASTGWYVLSRFPNAQLWTEFDAPPPEQEVRIAYRMTVFAARDVDPSEVAVLRPRPGSGHTDAFQVSTEASPPAGWKPYLSLRSGRRGMLDPRSFHAEAGEVIVEVLDARLGADDNELRWATAFLGDTLGRTQLQGLRAALEITTDGGSSWRPWFAGRVALPAAPSAGEHGPVLRLHVRDHRIEEYREVFVSCPHPDRWNFCRPAALLPIGLGIGRGDYDTPRPLTLDTPGWKHRAARMKAHVYRGETTGAYLVQLIKNDERLRPPRVLFDIAYRRDKVSERARLSGGEICPDVLVEMRKVRYAGGGKTVEWTRYYQLAPVKMPGTSIVDLEGFDGERISPIWIGDTEDREYKVVRYVGIRPFPPGHALHAALPDALGEGPDYEVVLYNFGPPRAGAPLLINGHDGVTIYRELLKGTLSDLDERTLAPRYAAIPVDEASFDAARARVVDEAAAEGETGGARMRFVIEQTYDLQRFFEREIAPVIQHASVVQPDGRIRLVDVRIPTRPGLLPVVEDDDYIRGDWEQGAETVTAVVATTDLFGWPDIELVEYRRGNQTPYGVPAMGIQRQSMGAALLSGFARNLPLSEHRIKLSGLRPVRADAVAVQEALLPVMQYYVHLFGTGSAYLDMRGRRLTLEDEDRFPGGLVQGTWAVVHTPESPNPAVNRRGGRRIMMLVQREDDGPELRLRWLDAGPEVNGVGIGLSNARRSPENPRHEVLVDVVAAHPAEPQAELQYAAVQPGAARPGEESPRWTATGFFPDGTARLSRLAGGLRIWIRGRRRGQVPERLPSDWTYAGPVDLEALPPPASMAAQVINGGDVRLTWIPGTAGVSTEIYRVEGPAPATWTPALLEATAPDGVREHLFYGLRSGTTYTVAIRHVDTLGAVSPFLVTQFTTRTVQDQAPRPAGIAVIVGAPA